MWVGSFGVEFVNIVLSACEFGFGQDSGAVYFGLLLLSLAGWI